MSVGGGESHVLPGGHVALREGRGKKLTMYVEEQQELVIIT